MSDYTSTTFSTAEKQKDKPKTEGDKYNDALVESARVLGREVGSGLWAIALAIALGLLMHGCYGAIR